MSTEESATEGAGEGDMTLRGAGRDLRESVALFIRRVAGWIRNPTLLRRVRGYVLVAIGVLAVTRVLHVIVGAVPGLPTEFAVAVLAVTLILAMLCYRQSVAFLRWHELRSRQTALADPGRTVTSEATRVAGERHWRARRATLWAMLAFVMLLTYSFGVMSCVRKANLATGEVPVIVPLLLPAPAAEYVNELGSTSNEPIDDILSNNPGYFQDAFPNEHPAYVFATVLPLQLVYAVFCLMVTRSLAFAVAPAPEAVPVGAAGAIEAKAAFNQPMPDGDDGLGEVLDLLNDLT